MKQFTVFMTLITAVVLISMSPNGGILMALGMAVLAIYIRTAHY